MTTAKTDIPSLSIVIPLYNEEERFPVTGETLRSFVTASVVTFPELEIIFVNDGSTDNTLALVQKFARDFPHHVQIISHEKNRGKGHAVRTGMRAATKKYALMSDADMSTDLCAAADFIGPMSDGVPVIIGSRKMPGARLEIRQPWWREFMGKGYTFLAQNILSVPVSDFTCGFKFFHIDARSAIFEKAMIDRWSYDAEILFLAKQNNFPIVEIPVIWRNDKRSAVRLYRDVIRSFLDLIIIRLRHTPRTRGTKNQKQK